VNVARAAVACVAFASAAVPALGAPARDAYADPAFAGALDAGMRAFYQRDFATAQADFTAALGVVPDNTLAIAFLNATAAQTPGGLDALTSAEEDRLADDAHGYVTQLRLGFSYAFAGTLGRDRSADAREALEAAAAASPDAAAPHDGLGILREDERSANRAKIEFLAALARDPHDVLAREYLAALYQVDLKDPQRGLSYAIDVPNVVPQYADIDFHIASLLHDLGQLPAAADYATRGLEIDIGHVGEAGRYGYTLLARIYLDEKRPADARRVLEASIAAGVDVEYARTLLARVGKS
jgi:tetratricopeptide (TPR) repeat protein